MKDRIRMIRKNAKMNQTEFGAMIGATQKMITTYETGVVVPDKSIRLLICQKFNVSETWLETGEGQPYVQTELVPELMHALQKYPELRATLERVIPRMDEEDWQALDRLLGKLKNPTE